MVLDITGIGSSLQGVGRAEDGRVVFVPFALPGERVDVNITRQAERFCEAEVARVLTPSPDRQAPACPLYGQCGGCQAQHMNYEASLSLKRQVVAQQLARIGGIHDADVRPVLPARRITHYRNKAEFSVMWQGGQPVVGMCRTGSNDVLPAPECLLQHPSSLTAASVTCDWLATTDARQVRNIVTRVNHNGDVMVILSAAGCAPDHMNELFARLNDALAGQVKSLITLMLAPHPAHATDGRVVAQLGEGVIYQKLCGHTFPLSPQSFFQVHTEQAEALYAQVLAAANLTGRENVLDAYCGCGTITLALAEQAGHVTGVEIVPPAVSNARESAKINRLTHKADFLLGDAAQLISRQLRGKKPDLAVVDPPRKGLDKALIDAFISARIPRIIYVSCDPGTLSRDVKRLTAGGYTLHYAQPVDMFPLTEHCEVVTYLTLNQKAICCT